MGFKLKGGLQEVHTIAKMIPVDDEILKCFEGPLREFKKAVGR
jgi:hypothetical protein